MVLKRITWLLLPLLVVVLLTSIASAHTSWAGWPPHQILLMDKGPAGEAVTLTCPHDGKHCWLLGGYGNATITANNAGDVIWSDYHPTGEPAHQTDVIYGGSGKDFIYANVSSSAVWTGTNPGTVVHAHFGSGAIHCQNPNIIVYTSHQALPHYKLYGCKRISFYTVGY